MTESKGQLEPIIWLYKFAKQKVINAGYKSEIELVQNRYFKDINENQFFEEYLFVIMCWGVREQIGRKDYDAFITSLDPSVIKNRFADKKREAAKIAMENFVRWYGELKCAKDPIKYLQSLPLIGKVMKLHLARNLGIDCVKPDRHMIRLASEYGFKTPLEMCEYIQKFYPNDRIGTIDVILWRWCNLRRPNDG